MNKKLLAVAVAGALAVPGVAFAQASSVTISGMFKVSLDNVNYSGATQAVQTGGTTGRAGNNSESRVSDNSSRIIFGIREDLGGGLAAIAQLDMRFNPATTSAVQGSGFGSITAGGNTWVGMQSTSLGKLTFGRHDLHYGKSGDSWNGAGAGSLQAWGSSIFDSIGRPVAGGAGNAPGTSNVSLANQTRTNQVVRWDSPNWNGFDATIAWSANPLTAPSGNVSTGGDLGAGIASNPAGSVITRRGDGWNINPRYNAANWGVEYSYWNAKGDVNSAGVQAQPQVVCNNAAVVGIGACPNAVAVTAGTQLIQDDQRSDLVAGYYQAGAFRLGLAWNRSKTKNVASGQTTADRDAWSVPISWTTGPHLLGFVWVRANDSKSVTTPTAIAANGVQAAIPAGGSLTGANTGAQMYTLTYQYDFSKRTALGLTWSQLTNKSAANYNFFYNSPTAFGSANASTLAGERVRLMALTVRHNF